MVIIRNDTSDNGMIKNFEVTISYILPYNPITKRKSTTKKYTFLIRDIAAEISLANTTLLSLRKLLKGKTGTEFRFCKIYEYSKLSKK